MLTEGHRLRAEGTDVVVGYVETHRRAQTQAQLGDLEVIPRKRFVYRGIALEEMDTEAILARHPQVALIDELAHSNIPRVPFNLTLTLPRGVSTVTLF